MFGLIAAVKVGLWVKRRGAAKPVGVAGQVMAGPTLAMPPMQPQAARPRQARLRRRVIGGGLALAAGGLWASGYLGVVLPILVSVVFYLGWRSLTRSVSRGIGVAAVSALDRVTGLQAARDRAESAAAQAGPRSLQQGTLQQGALIESREDGAMRGKMAMLRWAPFALGVAGLVGMAAWQGGSEGVQRLGHDLIAPFTGASPSVVQAQSAPKASAPAEAVAPARLADPAAAQVAPVAAPVAQSGLPGGLLGGMAPSLAMVGLMLLLAFAASYAQRWYTHRHALPADDPWERLDERLRLRREG